MTFCNPVAGYINTEHPSPHTWLFHPPPYSLSKEKLTRWRGHAVELRSEVCMQHRMWLMVQKTRTQNDSNIFFPQTNICWPDKWCKVHLIHSEVAWKDDVDCEVTVLLEVYCATVFWCECHFSVCVCWAGLAGERRLRINATVEEIYSSFLKQCPLM